MITVEELQILLQCDATQAQSVLDDIEKRVDAFVKNVEDAFNRAGGKNSNPLGDIEPDSINACTKAIKEMNSALATAAKTAKEVGNALNGASGTPGNVGIKKTTESLDKLSKKQKEVQQSAEEAKSSIDLGKVTVERDTTKPAPPLHESFERKYEGLSLNSGKPLAPLPDMSAVDEKIKEIFASMEQTLELAGEFRNRLADAFESPASVDFGDVLRNKISVVERDIDNLANKLIFAGKTGEGEQKQLAIEKSLQSAIERADRLLAKLNAIETMEPATEPEPTLPSAGTHFDFRSAFSFENIPSVLGKIKAAAEDAGESIKKAFSGTELAKFTARLKSTVTRMLMLRLVRGVINGVKQGFELLAASSESSAQALNRIKTAGSAVKASLATAVMPIIKALAPLFTQIASAAAAAANAIARFFAVLTGQSKYTAVTVKKDMDSIASSASGGGRALKGLLADFDELNVIQSEGGGGGGGGLDTSMFDTMDKDVDPPEWMIWIRDNLDDIKQLAIDVGAALLTWKIAKAFGADLKTTLGVAGAIAGATDMIQEFMDAWQNGLDWGNLTSMISDACIVVIGLGAAFGSVGASIGLIVSGAALFTAALKDWISRGKATTETLVAISTGILAIGAAISIFAGWIPLVVAAAVAAVTVITTLIAQNWQEVKAWSENALLDVKYFFANIGDAASQIMSRIGAAFSWLWSYIKVGFLSAIDFIVGLFENTLLGRVLGYVIPGLSDAIDGLRDDVTNSIDACRAEAEEAAKLLETPIKWGVEWDAEDKKRYEDNIRYLASMSITVPVYFEAVTSSVTGTSTVRNGYSKPKQAALPFASGGLVYGETFARIGEYVGARNNPEVVAPLSDLRNILASMNTGNSNGMTREQANTMIGLLQRVADKELTVEPSVELGRVTTQSLKAYGTI